MILYEYHLFIIYINSFIYNYIFKNYGFAVPALAGGHFGGKKHAVFSAAVLNGVNKLKFNVPAVFVGKGNAVIAFKFLCHGYSSSPASKS